MELARTTLAWARCDISFEVNNSDRFKLAGVFSSNRYAECTNRRLELKHLAPPAVDLPSGGLPDDVVKEDISDCIVGGELANVTIVG